ncbi:Beta-1,4-galactosyltransferase 1 [Schistosoma japonicum]|uniref:Beta-1,4-galactosyltransferase 1 n=1 Tax=Schistosoma japonicum TaxID=6182 RepID=A0A4Z2DG37_SCHJA|nr:Beta-1,4-galactosyltransferase 1 [Schistosoma japonicum]
MNVNSIPFNKVNTLKSVGRLKINDDFNHAINFINDTFYPQILGGGWMFRENTTNCSQLPQSGVAIIFVCRGRWKQLNNTLSTLIPLLQTQHLCYRIFVIDQEGDGLLNKATLFNVGFVEARKRFDFNCVIFHDADLIPLDDRIPHSCDDEVRKHAMHLSVGVSTWNYMLPYRSLIGGVLKISTDHFILANGYSNSYWGWGGEDDDLEIRLRASNIHYVHINSSIGRYLAQPHAKQIRSNGKLRQKLLKNAKKLFHHDGLNSLKYKIRLYSENLYFTYFLISLK